MIVVLSAGDSTKPDDAAREREMREASLDLREKAAQVSSMPAGGWHVTAELANVAGHDRSFSYSHGSVQRATSGDDFQAHSPAKAPADSHLSKFPPRTMKRTQSLPDSDRGKTGSEVSLHSSVSLGRVTHSSHVEVGTLLARACPQAVDTVDELMSSLPNDSSCIEGCLDLMRSLAQDPRHEPLSFAFFGMHRVKREVGFTARAVEFQLLQRIPSYMPPPHLRSDSPMSPSSHAPPSQPKATTMQEVPAQDVGRRHDESIHPGDSGPKSAKAQEEPEDMAKPRGWEDSGSLAGSGGGSPMMAVSLALTDVTVVKSDAWWCDSCQKQLAGMRRRMLGASAANGLAAGDMREEAGKVAGHAARHMRSLYTRRENVSKANGKCGSVLGVVNVIPELRQGSRWSAPGDPGGFVDSIPLDLLSRTCPGSSLDADTPANRSAIFVIHGQGAKVGEDESCRSRASAANGQAEADGSDLSSVLSFSLLKSTLSGMQGPQGVASGGSTERTASGDQEVDPPLVLKAAVCPLLVLGAESAAGAMLPAAYVWTLASEKLGRTLKERSRVADRNVNLVLDQSIPEIHRQAPYGLSRSKSFDNNLHSQSRGPQFYLPKVHLLRRSQSDKPKSALKAKPSSSAAGSGGMGNSLPKLHRHKSDDVPSARYLASPLMERALCYKQVVCFVRHCSRHDLKELEAALALPITWSMVSHRTWDNIANTSEASTPFSKSPSPATLNLEAFVQVQGIKVFLVHRDPLKNEALARRQVGCVVLRIELCCLARGHARGLVWGREPA